MISNFSDETSKEEDNALELLREKLQYLDSTYQTMLRDANLSLTFLKPWSSDLSSTEAVEEIEACTGELMGTRRDIFKERRELQQWIVQERMKFQIRKDELKSEISTVNTALAKV